MFRPPELSLYTDSRIFRGFSRVVVRHSLAEIFHDFSLCLPDRRKPGQELPLKMGEFCQLKAGDQLLACGFADYLSQSLGGEGTTLEIYGRSQAADLADSMPEPLEFPEEQSFRRIAEALLSPFSILLRTDSHADRLKLKQWKSEEGATAEESLRKAAAIGGLLLRGCPDGHLFAGKAPETQKPCGSLVQGKNLISATKSIDYSGLFAVYSVRAHQETEDGLTPVRGEVRAEHPRKGRSLRLFHDGVATKEDCEAMAAWERSSRQAEAFQYSVRVPGWCTEGGRLLECGTFVRLDCERIRTDESLLITEVSFEYSEKEGHTASLELRPAESLQAKPFFPEKQEDIWWE